MCIRDSEGDVQKKIKALEDIDREIVGPLLEHLKSTGDEWRLLVTPDHPTYCSTKTHTHGDVPMTIIGKGIEADTFQHYNESNAAESGIAFDAGSEMMKFFLGK